MSSLPPLPPGFELESAPPPPPGFVLENAQPSVAESASQTAPTPERPGKLAFLNQGIASGLGALPDLVAVIMNAGIGGANSLFGTEIPTAQMPSTTIGKGMSALGVDVAPPDVQPEGLVENFVAGTGGAAGGLVPFLGLGSMFSKAAGPIASGAGQTIMAPFTQAPTRALAAELAAGGGAGVGMDVADRVAPDSGMAQLVGAIMGGTIGGAGTYLGGQAVKHSPVVGTIIRKVQADLAPFTEAGAMERARNRVTSLAGDPEAAREALNSSEYGFLSPATSTGDERLMALERKVRDSDAPADKRMRDDEARSNAALRKAMQEPGAGGDSAVARQYMQDGLEQDVTGVTQTLDTALGTPQGVETTSTGIRQGSAGARSSAYDDAYAAPIDYAAPSGIQLQELVARVERAAPGTIALANRMMAGEGVQSQQILARIADDGTVSFERLPDTRQFDYITRALNQMARTGDGAGALGGQTDVGRIMSNLSREIRDNLKQANPAYGRALETAATPIGQREALMFGSELLNPSMARDVAADRIAGMTGPERAYAKQGLRAYIDETLANARASLAEPEVGVTQARQAVQRLSAPAVREKIRLLMTPAKPGENLPDGVSGLLPPPDGTPQVDGAAELFAKIDEFAASLDTRRSGPARFANARPGEEIRSLFTAPDPKASAAQLVARANADPTGQALLGVKNGFVDELMRQSQTVNFDAAGQPILSGRALRHAMRDNKISAVAGEVLSPEEMGRIGQIADELSKLETAQGRLPDIGNIMEGQPNSMITMAIRVVAANVGAKAGSGGSSLQTAQMASGRAKKLVEKLTFDKAEGLIHQAVTGDRELFEALLTPADQLTPKQEGRLMNVLTRTAIGTAGGAAGVSAGKDDAETVLPEIVVRPEPSLEDTIMGQ